MKIKFVAALLIALILGQNTVFASPSYNFSKKALLLSAIAGSSEAFRCRNGVCDPDRDGDGAITDAELIGTIIGVSLACCLCYACKKSSGDSSSAEDIAGEPAVDIEAPAPAPDNKMEISGDEKCDDISDDGIELEEIKL